LTSAAKFVSFNDDYFSLIFYVNFSFFLFEVGGRIVVAIILFKKDINGGQNEEDYMIKMG
jgi:hypothetical protein